LQKAGCGINFEPITKPSISTGLGRKCKAISPSQSRKRYMKCLADRFQMKFREGKTKRKKPPHF